MDFIVETLKQLLNTVNDVPPEVLGVAVETVFGAIIVSPVALGIKSWFKARKDMVPTERMMTIFVIVGSLFMAAFMYLVNTPTYGPILIMLQGWLVFATTQPVYFFFVKPLARRLSNWVGLHVANAMVKSEARNAAVPPEGIPGNTATWTDHNDFSQ